MLHGLCSFFVRSLVDSPDEVKIDHIETEKVDIFFLHVKKEDRGQILGKHGRTIGAVRTFLESIASHQERDVVVEVID